MTLSKAQRMSLTHTLTKEETIKRIEYVKKQLTYYPENTLGEISSLSYLVKLKKHLWNLEITDECYRLTI